MNPFPKGDLFVLKGNTLKKLEEVNSKLVTMSKKERQKLANSARKVAGYKRQSRANGVRNETS